MQARTLLEQGKLAEAIASLTSELRTRPGDLARRTFLFELLCFAGDLTRAERQLDAIDHLDPAPAAMLGVQVYRNLLAAEGQRSQLFHQGLRPRFLLDPPEEVGLCLEALELSRLGRSESARAALDRAAEVASPRGGARNGRPFEVILDADDLLAPVLEVFAPAGYFWVPWSQVQYLEVAPPQALRDLIWAPARLASFDGQLGEVVLPALYPDSHAHPDDLVKLGRATDWIERPGPIARGVGRKLLVVGDDAVSLLELGQIQMTPPDDSKA